MEEKNVFEGKTVDEAIENGLIELGVTSDEIEVEVLEEGKKKLFGSVKAKVRIKLKSSDSDRAVEFINGLLKIMEVEGSAEVVSEEESVVIDVKTPNSSRVIGKRGDVLDAIQCMAGAVANIGRDEYKKVVVDCENYRAQREETLKKLALKIAAKAEETGRKVILEPMASYERRVIHAALVDNEKVKTVSEGRDPARYIVVIPNNANPNDRGIRYGEKDRDRHGRGKDRDRRGRGDRKGRRDNKGSSGGGAKRGKKEIHFGTFLGNSNSEKND
ncbi:MAG: protein jag [Clostridiales bacterium]|nr:protein jag [Clostridiales bacterium]